MNGCVVYLYFDPKDRTPRYVGVGKNDGRPFEHLMPSVKSNRQLKAMLLKRRREGFDISPLILYMGNEDYKTAQDLERTLIATFGREDLGKGSLFNKTDGGDGVLGRIISEEEQQKRSASMKRTLADPATKARYSEAQKAAQNRPEVKAKRSASQKATAARKRAERLVRPAGIEPASEV